MKNTLRFLAKCILALLPVIALVTFTWACPMYYMDEEYPSWKYTMDMVKGKIDNSSGVDGASENNASSVKGEYNPHTLILGDSRAMAAFLPSELGDSCENLAVGGATPIEMYYFYSQYLKNHTAPQTVVVMFAPFHYSYMDNFETRTVYFNALTVSELSEVLKNAKSVGAKAAYYKGCAAYAISSRLRLPDVYLPAIYNARFIGRKSTNAALYDNFVKSQGQGYFGTADSNNEMASEAAYEHVKTGGDSDLIEIYMKKLLLLLEESGAQVILAQPPMNSETYDNINATYASEYASYLDELCGGYGNVIYSTDLVCYEAEMFGDPSHLNERGAKFFSEQFYTKYRDFL